MSKNVLTCALLTIVVTVAGCDLAAHGGASQRTAPPSPSEPDACQAVEEHLSGWGRRALPNPASLYCGEVGGDLWIENTEAGQSGLCVLPDGKEHDEWELYCGDCDAPAFCNPEHYD